MRNKILEKHWSEYESPSKKRAERHLKKLIRDSKIEFNMIIRDPLIKMIATLDRIIEELKLAELAKTKK